MRHVLWAAAVLVSAFAPFAAGAQVGRGGDPQSQLQLEAATLESRGDLAGAEAAYRSLLDLDPTSSGTVFALERVLRASGQLVELRPIVVAFLARSANPEVMALNLRLLFETDSAETMMAEAERWLAGNRSEGAYREVAGAYARAFGPARALEVLRRGRAAIGAGDALALEIGDLLAEGGDVDGAADEWALAINDASRVDPVIARVNELGSARAPDAGRRVAHALAESDLSARRDHGLSIALGLGLESEAMVLARGTADDLDGRPRTAYLESVATRARRANVARVAAWAYQELGGDTSNPEERRAFQRRIVDAALEAGDTVMALDAQRRVAGSFSRSSQEGRLAQAEIVRLEAAVAPERVGDSWREFREAFPDAPELDDVAAAIAMNLQARGDTAGAIQILEGVEGPRSTLERGYMLMAGGQIEEGRQALMLAVSGLPAVEATSIIQFGSLFTRLSEAGVSTLVDAGVRAHRGQGAEAAVALAAATSGLPAADRAPLLAEAARMSERDGSPERAVEIRERLLADFPDAPESAEASLAIARHIGATGGDKAVAIELLEDLITRRPNAAIVPEARLELERLRSRGS